MLERFFRPTDIGSLAAFRIIFGGMMLLAMLRYFAYGWIDAMYVAPQFFFTYEGFEWVRPWHGIGMYLHYAALAALAFCIAAGIAYRTCITLFFAGFTYANLIDKANYLNHYYLISLVACLMIFMPLGRAWSVDVRRQPERRIATAPQWMVWLLRFQLGVVYFFAGIAKLNSDWLLHAQPLKLWLAGQGEVPVLGPFLVSTWAPHLFSWAGAAFDLTIVFFLLWRRTRLPAYLTVVAFHVMTAMLFPIGLFPWIMIGLTTIYFEPDWPRRVGHWLRGVAATLQPERAMPYPMASTYRLAVIAALGSYALIQLAVPLRFLAAPGDISWTESGFRFSWRVMLIEKYGSAAFEIRDIATGERQIVNPASYLTPLQVRMMSTQPDMVLQFAHWLAARERQRGRDVQVRARVEVSLNGRPHQPLIDPDIDLAAVGRGTPISEWTLPTRANLSLLPSTVCYGGGASSQEG